jgi:hypothetical protein
LEKEREKIEEERVQLEEPVNCTEAVTAPEGLTTREAGITGLQVMGVFTLCGLLATLGWRGVTVPLIITSKAWRSKSTSKSVDACTSTSETMPKSETGHLKPASLSFRDERTRWEWPKRRTPPGRRARRTLWSRRHEVEMREGRGRQASWGGVCPTGKVRGSRLARRSGRIVKKRMNSNIDVM